MDFQENEPNWRSLPAAVFVLLLAIGAYWAPWPLEGERPPQMYGGVPIADIVQQVDARLWQDPFAAAYRHAEASLPSPKTVGESAQKTKIADLVRVFGQEPTPSLTWFRNIFRDKCGRDEKHKEPRCQTLAVMVFGAPYVGMEEYRRYTRYAVLAGLNLHGFVPVDAERIGYVMPQKDGLLPALIPFEWLTSEARGDVLLLWLDEEALRRPYTRSKNASSAGRPAKTGPGCPEGTDVLDRVAMVFCELGVSGDEIRILGPASSGTLSAMADADLPASLRAVRWYSASATSSKAWEKAGKTKLPITRVIAEDGELVQELADELAARGIVKGDIVALVGQWDTAYSRDLIKSLKEKLGDSGVHTVVAQYLRGIDGQLPGTNTAARSDDSSSEKDKISIERPEGDAQTDYLRRLAIELARQAQRDIRAVGVLGDDYHDKLLVLKALRHTFPEAVFFTTDLDAAMLHPGDNRYTRNLIVASSFGLTLHPNLQNRFPPFRNSYQTASYAATVIALGGEQLTLKGGERPNSSLLFEIGRTAPVRLNNPPETHACKLDDRRPWHWDACEDWQPARFNSPRRKVIVGTVMTVAAAGLLAFLLSTAFRRSVEAQWRITLFGIVLVGISTWWLITRLPSPLGEPFSWIEGVSVWPTEILYVVAVLMSFVMIRHGAARLLNGDQETETSFFRRADDQSARVDQDDSFTRAADIWKVYRARQIGLSELDTLLAIHPPEAPSPWKWRSFVRHNAAPLLGFLLLAAGSLVVFGIPQTPARGDARLLDWALASAAILSFTLLLFFVLDATRRVCWLAGKLAGETSWPDAALHKFGSPTAETARFFEDWLSLRVIAAATKHAGSLVYYPFFALFVLVLARSSLFDAWHIPLSLLFILVVAVMLMVMCVWGLRQTVEKARSNALTRMNDQLLEVQSKADADKALEKQVKTMIEHAQNLRTGAFSPLTRQPLVRAILGLASAISGIALLEYASVANI